MNFRTFTRSGAGVALGLALAGTALGQTWTGSSSPEDLRYRLDVLDAEIADIRARLGGGAVQRSSSAGAAELQQIEVRLQELTRRIEQLEFQQGQVAEETRRRLGDINFRLTELEGGDLGQVSEPAPLLPSPTPQAAPQPQAGGTQRTAALPVALAEQGELDRAARDVQQGRFDQGEDRLEDFISTYPSSPLIGDALYWLGESRFLRGNMQEAARHFLEAYQSNVTGSRAPHALYRLGVTLGRLGQINEACLTLREVRNQYPDGPADVVNKADAEADTLTCG